MPNDSMPGPERNGERVTFLYDGQPVVAMATDSVAAALYNAGIVSTRTTPVTGAPRAAYCMMGVCFECLVNIDGVASRQGCMTPVRNGMTVTPVQQAAALPAIQETSKP